MACGGQVWGTPGSSRTHHWLRAPACSDPLCESLSFLVCAVQLGDLYENDSIFDKFDCCFSGDGTQVATGTYSNCFRVVSRGNSRNGAPGNDQVLEASRDPQRKRLQQTLAKVGLPEPRLLDAFLRVLAMLSLWVPMSDVTEKVRCEEIQKEAGHLMCEHRVVYCLDRHAGRSISQRHCLVSQDGCIGPEG